MHFTVHWQEVRSPLVSPKILLATKLLFILIFAACLQVSATGYGQTVSISGNSLSLKEVFNQIREQTSYDLVYTDEILKGTHPVSIHMKDAGIPNVLDSCLHDQPLTYSIISNVIVIKRKNAGQTSLPVDLPIEVKGKVVNESGAPVPGATIIVKGTQLATVSDDNGNFVLSNVPENAALVVSSIGFDKQEVNVNGAGFITIQLKQKINKLDESVIIGYGTTTQRLNTGSVSSIKAADIERQPVSDPLLALQGRIPGLFIRQNSGLPGAQIGDILLRGRNSIANGNSPLFLIDGVPFSDESLTSTTFGGGEVFLSPFNIINPSDIERIDVLKDADATAIYGSRGANGVILITTKKGIPGKTKISINAYSGIGKVTSKLNLLNTREYLQMRREAFKNDGMTPGPIDYDINGTWDTTRYTDWQDVFIGGTAHFHNLNASISGGSANTQFLMSTSYHRETTVYPGSYSDNKISFKANINHQSDNRKFRFQFETSYLIDNSKLPRVNLINSIRLAPDAPSVYDSLGNINWENETWTNPFAAMLRTADAISKNLSGNLVVEYNIIKGLQIRSTFGYSNIEMNQSMITPLSSWAPRFGQQTYRRGNRLATNSRKSWIVEPQIDYNVNFKSIKANVLIGTTLQEDKKESISQSVYDFINDALIKNPLAAAGTSISGYEFSIYHYNAFFGRLNLNYNDKYLLNITGRRDGSSRFGDKNKFGNFGAIGVAWLFSNENFILHPNDRFSFGKLRVSYGTTGNDQLGDYQYLSSYGTYSLPYQGATGLYPLRISNPNFGWERVNKLEFGLNLGFFKDRILFDFDYFDNRTINQLVGYPLPAITGFPSITANFPAVIRNWGWEIQTVSENIKNDKFRWNTTFNITIPNNRLLSYPDIEHSTYVNLYEVGKSLFIQPSLHYTGIDPKTGVYTFEDVDGDGIITMPNDLKKEIELTQDFFGGFGNDISYKNFSLNFFFQFVHQTGRNLHGTYLTMPGRSLNQPKEMLERWQYKNDQTNIQKFTQSNGSEAGKAWTFMAYSNFKFGDASFIRLTNASLSYYIPQKVINHLKLQSARLYFQGQNLLTITNYFGLDPETTSALMNLPPLRICTIGIQVSI